jgi:hypothetical protein
MTDPVEPTEDTLPPDPFGPVHSAAMELHTIYTNFKDVGFTDEQAMTLVQAALVKHMEMQAILGLAKKQMGLE